MEEKLDQMRPAKITRSYLKGAPGSVLIEMGDTKVICTATIEEQVPPFLRNKGVGWLTAEYGMLPRSSPQRIRRESSAGKVGGRTHDTEAYRTLASGGGGPVRNRRAHVHNGLRRYPG